MYGANVDRTGAERDMEAGESNGVEDAEERHTCVSGILSCQLSF